MKSDYVIVSNALKFMQEKGNIVKVDKLTLSMVLSDAVSGTAVCDLGNCEGFSPEAFATERVIRRANEVLFGMYQYYSSPFQSITDAEAIKYLKVLKRHFR